MIFISGKFTAPRAGVYLITYSYRGSNDPGEGTYVYIYKDGVKLVETENSNYYSSGGSGWMTSTGGRAVYQRLEAGNTIHLGTSTVSGQMSRIILCVEFINI